MTDEDIDIAHHQEVLTKLKKIRHSLDDLPDVGSTEYSMHFTTMLVSYDDAVDALEHEIMKAKKNAR